MYTKRDAVLYLFGDGIIDCPFPSLVCFPKPIYEPTKILLKRKAVILFITTVFQVSFDAVVSSLSPLLS